MEERRERPHLPTVAEKNHIPDRSHEPICVDEERKKRDKKDADKVQKASFSPAE